jgi:predicted porin
MKKSLLALAVLGAYAGVASAQSSVQLFGTLDVNARYIKNDGRERAFTQSTDGINSSELRFQGIEDLGGGLKAGFNLRSGINPDTGTANAKFWNRRATVSLYTNAGELRLGRDYVPTFWTQALFDPFGYNGIGSVGNVARYGQVRADNSFGYFLPSNLGGFYGQLMYSANEAGTNADRPARYIGGQFGFRAGPFDVAAGYAETDYGVVGIAGNAVTGLPAIPVGTKVKTGNIGGSFDFGFAKIMGFYDEEKLQVGKEKRWEVGATFPFGQSEVRVGYQEDKMDANVGLDSKVTNVAATYQYNLSKRTALYGTAALLQNKDATSVSLPGGTIGGPNAGGDSKGFELGVRHFF